MTDAERRARYRAARAAGMPVKAICDLDLGELQGLNRRAASAVTEQRDGLNWHRPR
jgi:imidazolonepropionase-like amidohydrolase